MRARAAAAIRSSRTPGRGRCPDAPVVRWQDADDEVTASGGQVSVATIKKTIDEHPEWQAKSGRAEFSDANLASTLKGLRHFGFIGQEGGRS